MISSDIPGYIALRSCCILTAALMLLPTSAARAAQEPAEFRAYQPFAGICAHTLHPAALLDTLEDFSRLTGEQPAIYWDLKKNVERRFAVNEHLPLQKGFLAVFGPNGFSRLDFEYVLDATGAGLVIDEFSQQWKTATPATRPLYEVEIQQIDDNSWELVTQSLIWTPVVPRNPNADVSWESTSMPFRTIHFRLADGFLWYGNDARTVHQTQLHALPKSFLHAEAPASGSRLATIWFEPDSIPESLRSAWFDTIQTALNPALQQRDEEDPQTADTRSMPAMIQRELLKCGLFDVKRSLIFLDIDADVVSLRGGVSVKQGSAAGRWLNAVVPRGVARLPLPDSADGLRFHAGFRLPNPIIDNTSQALVPIEEAPSISSSGLFRLPPVDGPEHGRPAGWLELAISSGFEQLLSRMTPQLQLVTGVVLGHPGISGASDSFEAQQQARFPTISLTPVEPRGVRLSWGNATADVPDSTAVDHPTKEFSSHQQAHLSIRANGDFLRELRKRLFRSGIEDRSGTEDRIQQGEDFILSLSVDSDGIKLSATAGRTTGFELLAVLAAAGFRI